MDVFRTVQQDDTEHRKEIAKEIEQQEKILFNARKRFMLEEIDADNFKVIKAEASEKLRLLEAKLTEMPNKRDSLKTIEGLLDIVIER